MFSFFFFLFYLNYLYFSFSTHIHIHIHILLFSTLYFFFCIDNRTATVEGTEMKQVLSTFSKLEQSRFEAFRKASFPGDAIGTYVAHCLMNEQHRSISTGDKSTSSERGGNEEAAATVATNTSSTASIVSNSTRLRYLRPTTATTTTTAATSTRRKQKPILSDVVATGQSGDITVVVSTLAKAYAQRLVLAARKYSIERRSRRKISVHDENSNNDDDDDEEEEEEEEEDIAISPEDILKAYDDREVRGLDPGFFLQARGTKNNSGSSNSGCTNVNLLLTENDQRYTLNRSVVLSAQDDYYNNMKNENDNDNDSNNDNDNDNDNDNMEIDVDDEHNNKNVDTTNDNNVVADKDKGGNDEKNINDGDDNDDDDDDPVDESVKLFSLLVNQINARQNGGTTVTALSSSDYDNSIGIGSDIIADSNKSNKLDGNKNESEKEDVIVDENNNDKKKGISNINNTDNNVTATELVAVPIDTSSDGTTTTANTTTTTTINNDSTEDAATTLATTNTTTIDTKSEEDNA
jgi:hypothetical protein